MIRRRIARGVAAIACAALIAACGGGSGDSDGVQTISFWHSMGGKNGEAVQALVDRYNEQNAGKVRVEAIYQGKYNDSLTKLRASIQSRQTPNLVQVFEIGTRLMYDTKATVPFADLAADGGIDVDQIEPGIARYYTVDGKLQSLPFNASAPMLFYNKTAFAEVGLDPEKPPTTLAELADAARKLTVRSGGNVTRYGFVASIDGWLVEQLLANAGVEYCDKGNGREGLPTAVNWDNPTLRNIVQTWAGLINSGDGLNVGRNNTDASAAFQAGRAAILPFTSANLRDIISGSDFEVGVANYIRAEAGQTGGVFNGGGSVWTMAGHPKAKQEAAVDFLKYLASAETQAQWAAQTGYIAINRTAEETAAFKEILTTYPDFAKPAAQVRQAPDTPASHGCLMGVMPQARDKMNDVVEAVILGRSTPDQAIAESQRALTPVIESYNKSVGQ
ncbi:ABC transporter substrate-binding protein [Polymorphospora sp. NPDC050346]|uniref:ABC transporter substrate-binding protein n=1 Tax=Polymorphospora sp. NPDC050346 TaxID=3155780 RepID=UPI0033C4637B